MNLTNLPNETTPLSILNSMAKGLIASSAENAWRIGQLFAMVCKCPDVKRKQRGQWRKEHLGTLSQPTISRAIGLYEKFPDLTNVTEEQLQAEFRAINNPKRTQSPKPQADEKMKEEFKDLVVGMNKRPTSAGDLESTLYRVAVILTDVQNLVCSATDDERKRLKVKVKELANQVKAINALLSTKTPVAEVAEGRVA
jgi:hypothetical protein